MEQVNFFLGGWVFTWLLGVTVAIVIGIVRWRRPSYFSEHRDEMYAVLIFGTLPSLLVGAFCMLLMRVSLYGYFETLAL